jgi:hypothetical protein
MIILGRDQEDWGSKQAKSQAPVPHAYNPSYSGSRDQEDCRSKSAPGKIVCETLLRIPSTKMAFRVVQVVEHPPGNCETLQFKPCHSKNNGEVMQASARVLASYVRHILVYQWIKKCLLVVPFFVIPILVVNYNTLLVLGDFIVMILYMYTVYLEQDYPSINISFSPFWTVFGEFRSGSLIIIITYQFILKTIRCSPLLVKLISPFWDESKWIKQLCSVPTYAEIWDNELAF